MLFDSKKFRSALVQKRMFDLDLNHADAAVQIGEGMTAEKLKIIEDNERPPDINEVCSCLTWLEVKKPTTFFTNIMTEETKKKETKAEPQIPGGK